MPYRRLFQLKSDINDCLKVITGEGHIGPYIQVLSIIYGFIWFLRLLFCKNEIFWFYIKGIIINKP
ncbi:hypothetical protein, partial [Xenorhabdus sp. NBAII XenSa04]|uniref:hypothetical protein n=1 Tax=Xenorhabdus sp. NBAII XenSa04 TaxID=1429873 RepID=UPI001E45DAD4